MLLSIKAFLCTFYHGFGPKKSVFVSEAAVPDSERQKTAATFIVTAE